MKEVGKTDKHAGGREENCDEGGEAEGPDDLGWGLVVGLCFEVLQVSTYTDASDIGIGGCEGAFVRVSGAVGRDGTTHDCKVAEKNMRRKCNRKQSKAETRFKSQATLSNVTQSQNLMEKEEHSPHIVQQQKPSLPRPPHKAAMYET